MRKLIAILVILAFGYGVVALFNYYDEVKKRTDSGATSQFTQAAVEVSAESLPGLPPQYEAALKTAQAGGAEAMGKWLKTYGPYCADPRRASIELDYAAMLIRTDTEQAKKLFRAVQKRTPSDSPLYPRIKRLEPGYN
jgi:hypothetical protein